MIELPNVTVIIVDTKNYAGAIHAIKKTLEQIKPAETIWFSDRGDFDLPGVVISPIAPIKSKADYSRFLIKGLVDAFKTSHCLVIQHDGYVLNGDQWDDEFLKYDYIGAPWLYPDPDRNVGNGGFSLRSKALQTVLKYSDEIEIVEPEDEIIGRLYRRFLEEKEGLVFAPEKVAHKFSYELHEPYGPTFGFHGYFHPPFKPVVVVNRTGAMGDVIQVEPVLHEFHKQGYRVVLKTLPQFYSLFANHYFPVESFDTLNKALPYKEVDLDMAYEINPKQLHMKSYFEIAGISGDISKPKLNYNASSDIKIFRQKYVVIHVDRREQPHRNADHVAWWKVTDYLKSKGYLVVQIGKNDSLNLDAIQINTIEIPMMAYVIAGCDLFIGVDSGPSHVAVATGRKSVILFGSVNPMYIHSDFENIRPIVVHSPDKPVCSIPFCWHNSITTTGQDCYVSSFRPPCTEFGSERIINAINELIC
jgi:ADP-heptose:LPS heptosyltransferase